MKISPALRFPGRYFISHAYADAQAVSDLLKLLPWWMRAVVFPAQRVDRTELVSNPILRSIRRCTGLIYIDGGESNRSFWVALERDYALRNNRVVYAFDPISKRLRRDFSRSLKLQVYSAYSRSDMEVIEPVASLLRRRFFNREPLEQLPSLEIQANIQYSIRSRLESGYLIIFLSAASAQSHMVTAEVEFATREFPERVLLVRLDNTPLPSWLSEVPLANSIQLYGDIERSQTNRMDDVIISLYWLIYRGWKQ